MTTQKSISYNIADRIFKILSEFSEAPKKRFRLLRPSLFQFLMWLTAPFGFVAYMFGENGESDAAIKLSIAIGVYWLLVIGYASTQLIAKTTCSPILVLRKRFESEALLIARLQEFSLHGLELAKARIQTQRECYEPRSTATDAIPQIVVALGVLLVAVSHLEIAKVLNFSFSTSAAALGAYFVALLVLAGKWANFRSGLEVAKLREFEGYLDAAIHLKLNS